jgi:hypothetical protein
MKTYQNEPLLCGCKRPALPNHLTCGLPSCNAAALRELQQEERDRKADRDDQGLSPDL